MSDAVFFFFVSRLVCSGLALDEENRGNLSQPHLGPFMYFLGYRDAP